MKKPAVKTCHDKLVGWVEKMLELTAKLAQSLAAVWGEEKKETRTVTD